MAQTFEAIVILLIIWQLMTRFRKNVRLSPNAKSQFQEAIDDAKDRLPNTGLFTIFKGDSAVHENIDEPEIKIEQTIIPIKHNDKESLE